MLSDHFGKLGTAFPFDGKTVLVSEGTDLRKLEKSNRWLLREKLVAKPDQLFGKKGKNGLVLLNAGWSEVKDFLKRSLGKRVSVGGVRGELTHFLVEPFVPHKREYFLALNAQREFDEILFSPLGGVDVEEHPESVKSFKVPVFEELDEEKLLSFFEQILGKGDGRRVCGFVSSLYSFFVDRGFSSLELNPLGDDGTCLIPIGCASVLDSTEEFKCKAKWFGAEFPPQFGMNATREEKYIRELDAKSGASMKLTLLNPKGRIWLLTAGGGASVIFADTVSDLGFGSELANYGEYSGNPSEDEVFEYAKTLIGLMTREKAKGGKILIIGGAIANFTDVAKTFLGIVRAMREEQAKLRNSGVRVFVRRGGPNFEKGLEMMRTLGEEMRIPISVFGPEEYMTSVVSMAIRELNGKKSKGRKPRVKGI
jgi:ATP-citrate lyase beta-subunit